MKRLIIIFAFGLILSNQVFGNTFSKNEVCDNIYQILNTKYDEFDILIGDYSETEYIVIADLHPNANWGHECIHYRILKSADNNEVIIKDSEHKQFPPYGISLETWNKGILKSVGGDDASSQFYYNVPTRNIKPAYNYYAVIISGGHTSSINRIRYWNDCSYIYSVLRKFYNIPKGNIELFMSDGDDPGLDIEDKYSSGLDLDHDGINDLKYSATYQNISGHLNKLSETLTENDHLFIFVIDHGCLDELRDESYICLWNEEALYASDLDKKLDRINCASINCVFGQCNSGGFIEPLQANNRVISTACTKGQLSHGDDNGQFDTFVNAWTKALLEIGNITSDVDADNHISMKEAFDYAIKNDIKGPYYLRYETPQYYSGTAELGEYLSFDRYARLINLHIRDNIEDDGNELSTSKSICNSPDIWIRNRNDFEESQQNPKFAFWGTSTNYINVRLTNKGILDYTPSSTLHYIHFYWCVGTPHPTYDLISGNLASSDNRPFGGFIATMPIEDYIKSGEDVILSVPWSISKGAFAMMENSRPISILALVSDDERGLFADSFIDKYVYDPSFTNSQLLPVVTSPQIAIKNIYIPSIISSNSWKSDLTINGHAKSQRSYNLSIREENHDIFDYMSFKISFPKDISLKYGISNSDVNSPTYDFDLDFDQRSIKGIYLDPNDVKSISITAYLKSCNYNGTLYPEIFLQDDTELSITGSYQFKCNLEDGLLNTKSTNINEISHNAEELKLSADLQGFASDNYDIEWIDHNGEILSSNKILNLPSDYQGNVSLLVYSDDGVLIDTKSINNTKLIKNVSITPDEITITLSNPISSPTKLSIISLDTVSSSYITDILPDETEIKIPRSSLIDGCYYTFILSSQNIILDFIKIINTL